MHGRISILLSAILAGLLLCSCTFVSDAASYIPVDDGEEWNGYIEQVETVFRQAAAVNENTFGAVLIPGTLLCLPVMRPCEDPLEYLRKDVSGDYSVRGTPFILKGGSETFDDLVICGHYFNNGEVFGMLHSYLDDPSFIEAHPILLLCTDVGTREYSICGCEVFGSAELERAATNKDGFRNLLGIKTGRGGMIVLVTCMDYRGSGDRRVLWAVKEW